MKRALIASLLFSMSAIPFGLLLQLRRLSLVGEAISHGVLPGIALAHVFFGFWIPALLIGGVSSGLTLLVLSHLLSKSTRKSEDSVLSTLYLLFLSIGVLIVSLKIKGTCNITHLLFGNILAIDQESLIWTSILSCFTFSLFLFFYRLFVYECFDSHFQKQMGYNVTIIYVGFLTLVTVNIVLACQSMGTLMALGMMLIPVSTARILSQHFKYILVCALFISILSTLIGLLVAYHLNLPAGPAMIITSGLLYIFSFLKRCFSFIKIES